MRWMGLALCLAFAFAALTTVARAQQPTPPAAGAAADEEARVHFRVGRAYYDSGRFAEAATEFEAAYRMSNRAQLLYNIFVAHRDAGNLGPAIDALRRYLDLVPNADDRDQLRARLSSMERLYLEQNASRTTPPPAATVAPTTPTAPVHTEPVVAADPRPPVVTPTPVDTASVTDVTTAPVSDTSLADETTSAPPEAEVSHGPGALPYIVAGVGAGLLVGSIFTGLAAKSKENQLNEGCNASHECPPELESVANSGRTMATLTNVFMITGAVAVATGLVLFFTMGDHGHSDAAPQTARVIPSFGCGAHECGASVQVRF